MLVFTIEQSEIKTFMDKLFRSDAFDNLEVKNICLETIVNYDISGNINKEYLSEAEERTYIKWSELKPYVFQLIKGDKKPKCFKMIFMPDKEAILKLHDNAASMSINLIYENNIIKGTTGTSQKNFSLDKSLDNIWENTVRKFFKKNGIVIVE